MDSGRRYLHIIVSVERYLFACLLVEFAVVSCGSLG